MTNSELTELTRLMILAKMKQNEDYILTVKPVVLAIRSLFNSHE